MATSEAICQRLVKAAQARLVVLANIEGKLIASAGDLTRFDLPGERIGRTLTEEEFVIGHPDGGGDLFYFSRVGSRQVLMVVFDDGTPIAVIRAQSRIARDELTQSASMEK